MQHDSNCQYMKKWIHKWINKKRKFTYHACSHNQLCPAVFCRKKGKDTLSIKEHVVSRSKGFKKGEKCEPPSSRGETEPEYLFKYCTLKKTSVNKQRVRSTYTFAERQRNKTQPETLMSQKKAMVLHSRVGNSFSSDLPTFQNTTECNWVNYKSSRVTSCSS